MKIKLLNKFGNPFPIQGVSEITVEFDGERAPITKKLSQARVCIESVEGGEINVEIKDFDIQAMRVGKRLSALVHVKLNNQTTTFRIPESYDVELDGERKILKL